MELIHQRYLDALRRSQFAPPAQLAASQLALLERLVRSAKQHVPYYRDRLACLFKGGNFQPEAWPDVPTISREEVQDHATELYAESVPPEAGTGIDGETSGTVGSRLKFRQSHLSVIASDCQMERMLEVHGIDRTAHEASIRVDRDASFPEGREHTGWNLTCQTSRRSSLHVGVPIAEQAEWLLRRAPRYLVTYPSNAAALAQHLGSIGAALRLAGLLTVGEQVGADHRELVARAFGCRLYDSYGATEVGYLAFECPAGGGYHLAHESVLIEVIDERGRPVIPGTLGRVVITSLYNYVMPFIRYAIDDYAVAAVGPCPCGRTLPRLASIAGRARNIFTFADGSQQSPWGWRGDFRPLLPAKQMQIVQTAVDTIEIRYVPRDGAPLPDAARIAEAGRHRIHPTVTVKAIAVDRIARSPSGKMEDCISLVVPSPR